jgi:hypothetical protein
MALRGIGIEPGNPSGNVPIVVWAGRKGNEEMKKN